MSKENHGDISRFRASFAGVDPYIEMDASALVRVASRLHVWLLSIDGHW
jgi:hypothetical protein